MTEEKQKHLRELRIDAASYSKLGNHSRAEATIKKALELDNSSNRLKHELAKIYLKSNLYKIYRYNLELIICKDPSIKPGSRVQSVIICKL